ncbi:MAG: hypothetical protein DRP45_04500 [Candidatus Zixiibacteriota bacterium]|nr:MAG: hypothetical protein DRP45_04500 [candidate division Zixibacteria bacterium]
MELKFTKGTDSEHKIKLDSILIAASWRSGLAYAGQSVEFEVRTALVGEGAPVKITGKSEKGKKLGKVEGQMRGNAFIGQFDIPADTEIGDEVFFEVKLSKNSLNGESGRIPVRPAVAVSGLKWSDKEARRGDVLTLTADVAGVAPETEAKITIYEYDQDSAHDRIVELPAKVIGGKIELEWAYEYHEDTDEIPIEEQLQTHGRKYNHPEYFFTVKFERTEFGLDQESGLLEFKDWMEIAFFDRGGQPREGEKYQVKLADGTTRDGKLNADGFVRIEDVPPGPVRVEFPDSPGMQQDEGA